MEVFEAPGYARAEALHRSPYAIEGLACHVAAFGVEAVGVAYEFFEQCLGHVCATGGEGECGVGDFVVGESGARVSFGYACEGLVDAVGTQHIGTSGTVGEVGQAAVAVDARCVGGYYADVVEHGGGFDVSAVERQLFLTRYTEGEVGDTAAVEQQYVADLAS